MEKTHHIQGLQFIENYISADESQALQVCLDQGVWNTDMKRRVQHFGYRYDYKARSVSQSDRLEDWPVWADDLAGRLYEDHFFQHKPDQVIINDYAPGQGISAHVDCEPCFGPVIASVSLLSACDMLFQHRTSGHIVPVRLAPMSLLVLSGEARYNWTHAIPARKSDLVNGIRVPRSRRMSLTFRTVLTDDP
jgi:alkylated DNA repair dioxygenase AlkB